jgi:hypothetical protein
MREREREREREKAMLYLYIHCFTSVCLGTILRNVIFIEISLGTSEIYNIFHAN